MIETRGVWLTDTDSKVLSKQSIAEAMEFLALTALTCVSRGLAVTLILQVMSRYFNVEIPAITRSRPLAELIGEAHLLASKLSLV